MKYLAAIFLAASVAAPSAAVELITNGGFEQTTLATSSQFGKRFPRWGGGGLDGGRVHLPVLPGHAGPAGGERGIWLLPAVLWAGERLQQRADGDEPGWRQSLLLDGDTDPTLQASVSQVVTGLTVGKPVRLSFWMAGSQQLTYPGPTYDKYFKVTFGDEIGWSDVLEGPEASFQPWRRNVMLFTPTRVTQTLTFLAHGMPWGMPPLLHLDGVSMSSAVPEPATWAMLIVGFGLVGAAARRRAEIARVAA
jgi:hypothetical protein